MITVHTPDGGVAQFPDGTPPEAIQNAMRQKFGGPARASDKGGVVAAVHGAIDTASFGLFDKAAPYIGAALTGESVDQARGEIQGNESATSDAHPVASIAGDIAGVGLGGGVLSAGLKLAKGIPVAGRVAEAVDSALAARKGQGVRNVARAATAGAAFSAADAAGHGGNADDVLLATAAGAITGPIAGKVITSALKAVSPAAQKAMRLLADKIGEKPEVLQNAFVNFKQQTGRNPTMAELVGLKTQGELRQVAADNPTVGAAMQGAQDSADAGRAASLPQRVQQIGGSTTDISTLSQARKATMTAAMNPIRDTKVPVNEDDLGLLMDRRVRAATNADPVLQRKINAVMQDLAFNPKGVSERLTVNDFDAIRKSLRGRQTVYANTMSPSHNPHTAESYGNLADNIAQIAIDTEPGYGDALEQFGRDSDFIKGFKHGNSGKLVGEAERPDLISALNRPEGAQGHAVGVVSRLVKQAGDSEAGATAVARQLAQDGGLHGALQEALGSGAASRLQTVGRTEAGGARALGNVVSGGAPRAETTESNVMHAAHAAAAVTYHSPTAIGYHVSRIFGGKLKLSPLVQQKVAQYLADPKMTQQGINLLRRAGASNEDLRRLATSIAASTGAAVGNTVTGH